MQQAKMIDCSVFCVLLLIGAFVAHAEDSGVDPARKLSKAVAAAWNNAYPTANVVAVIVNDGVTRIKASDELNTEFTAEFDSNGSLLRQSTRKVAFADLPAAIRKAQKQLPGYEWDLEHIQSSKAPDGKLLYNCRAKANQKLILVVWTEEGLIHEMGPILTPEEQKAADLAKAREVTIKVTLDQNGRIIYDGKAITDDEYKKLLDRQPKDKKLVIEVHFSTVSDDRLIEFRRLYKGAYTLKITRDAIPANK